MIAAAGAGYGVGGLLGSSDRFVLRGDVAGWKQSCVDLTNVVNARAEIANLIEAAAILTDVGVQDVAAHDDREVPACSTVKVAGQCERARRGVINAIDDAHERDAIEQIELEPAARFSLGLRNQVELDRYCPTPHDRRILRDLREHGA